MTAIFIRTSADNKCKKLLDSVMGMRQGAAILADTYLADPCSFVLIPNGPFTYSVSYQVRALFKTLLPFENSGIMARAGLCTGNDFRFVRLIWETKAIGYSLDVSRWMPFAKGGKFACYYSDIHLAVSWSNFGEEIIAGATNGSVPGARPQNISFFFRPGLTWPLRTQSGLGFRVLPARCVFGHKGPCAFTDGDDHKTLLSLLALTVSQVFRGLVEIQMAFGSYEVGVIQRTVVPKNLDPRLGELALAAWTAKRSTDTANPTSHAFLRPALAKPGSTLAKGIESWSSLLCESAAILDAVQSEIDSIAYRLYGLGEEDRRAIEKILSSPEGGSQDSTGANEDDEEVEDSPAAEVSNPSLVSELLDYALGCAFGRLDIRYATSAQSAPELPGSFAPLPVCPPGQLQNKQGMPARSEDVPAAYPVCIPWDGILVDDPIHSFDIERRVREVIEIIWSDQEGGPTAEAIEHEACEILGVKSFRDYFRKPTGFFADHLKRYSKSRRQAPIYWPLSTASGSYTLWIYYHRLTPDTLYKCVQQFINPMLADVEKELNHLRTVLAANEGGVKERKHLEELEDLRREVIELRAELELWAPKWKPNLNDGVLITAAPLWKLFRLPKWQKDLKACWQKLEKGDYDWSHLAHTLWPARVREKCKSDRSLAIAHGLEELCAVQAQVKRAEKAKKQLETELKMEP